MKTITIGTFGFIKNPDVKVLRIPDYQPLNSSIANGVKKTVFPRELAETPTNNGCTKANAKGWFGNFNSALYDYVVSLKLNN